MGVHIEAEKSQIAESILLPGDPLRAKFIAENFLENVIQYNNVRGMLGFTGTYKGAKVSVQGTGMGMPSIGIYANELIRDYGVKNLIRVGSCGSYREEVKVRDIILAMGASTDSKMNELKFGGLDFAPIASFKLLLNAHNAAKNLGIHPHVGNILSSDTFYHDENELSKDDEGKLINLIPNRQKNLINHGVLAVEMEAAALYTIAAKFGVHALAILTVSDHLLTFEATTSAERESTFGDMVKIALETVLE
jgi:purine-nucleoside phosphorylase